MRPMQVLLAVLALALGLSLNIPDTEQTETKAETKITETKTKTEAKTKAETKARTFEGDDPEVQVFVVFVVTLAAATLGNLLLPADPDPAETEAPTFTLTSCRCGVERVGGRIVGGTAVNPVSCKMCLNYVYLNIFSSFRSTNIPGLCEYLAGRQETIQKQEVSAVGHW